jgi:hypothetical protein
MTENRVSQRFWMVVLDVGQQLVPFELTLKALANSSPGLELANAFSVIARGRAKKGQADWVFMKRGRLRTVCEAMPIIFHSSFFISHLSLVTKSLSVLPNIAGDRISARSLARSR